MRKRMNRSGNSRQYFGFDRILPKSKRSQETLGIGFGVIFSIILIVFFLVVAGIVINSFLHTQKCAELGIFIDRFDSSVQRTWNSQTFSGEFEGILPGSIDYVCFGNLSNSLKGEFKDEGFDIAIYEGQRANTYFYPTNKACEMPYNQINHLDVERITRINNPNCVPVREGRIVINVQKSINDRLVNVEI